MIKITISGVEQEFVKDDFRIDKAVDERSTCRFTVTDWTGEKVFRRGQPVLVYQGETLKYGGIIETAKRRRKSSKAAVLHAITCIDWHYLTDKRIVARAYEKMTPGAIITALHTDYLTEEGITLGTIDPGETIEDTVFNYIPASRAIDALKEATNYWWIISPDKSLDFMAPEHYVYPDTITWEDMIGDPQVEEGNPKYRNRQWIRGGRDLTGEQIEYKKGDGESQDFVLGYRVGTVPTFEISYDGGAYQEEHRGIKGLDVTPKGVVSTDGTAVTRISGTRFMPAWEGRAIIINEVRYTVAGYIDDTNLTLTESAGTQASVDFIVPIWFWEKYSETVTRDRELPPLVAADLMKITYRGLVDIIVRSQDNQAILDLQEIEGSGTGFVEAIMEMDNPSRQAAFEAGASALAKYAREGKTIKFKTLKEGIEPGHLVTIDLPEYYLEEAEMLVESVQVFCASTTELGYDIKAVEGPTHGSWTKFFGELATRGETMVVRENISEIEILTLLFEFSKNWALEPNELNIMKRVTPGADLYPGADTFPMFDYGDRIKYIEWKVDGAVVGRKQMMDRQDMETDTILTAGYLAPYEAIGMVEEIHWYGGIDAAAEKGTGIKVISETFDQEKTKSESWDIRRTDRWEE